MTDFTIRFAEFKQSIDALNQAILKTIQDGHFGKTNELLNQRYDLLTELIAIVKTKADKELILPYLNAFQQSDHALMSLVQKERSQIAETMHNLNNLIQYTNV